MQIQNIDVKIKMIDAGAQIPKYGTDFAAGADLYAVTNEPISINPGQTAFIHTGISMEIPTGVVGIVTARSGLACKQGLAPANKIGVIDSDYRGEIMVALHNHSKEPRTVQNGDRIAQMMFLPYFTAVFTETETLDDTTRGAGGFGSTGR